MQTSIKHHLTPGLMMAYAAGTLPEAFNLMVASHISLCPDCRAEVESYEALGGEVITQHAPQVAMAPGSLEATLALIAGGPMAEVKPKRAPSSVLPGPLQDYVGISLDDIAWKPVAMGVRQSILKTSDQASARLLFIPAGAAMPDHSHKGLEMTMVLHGAFQDEHDYFARGDVEIADSDTHHTPVADIHEDCICLAVTDAPLKFRGILPRLAQPFLQI